MEAIVSVQYKEEQKVGDDQEVFTGAIWVKFWEVERCRRWPGSIHWSSPSEILSRRWSRIRWRSPSENRRSNDERWVLEKNLVGVERGRRWSGFHWSSPSENRRCNDERHGSSWSGDSLWIYLFVQVSRPPDKNTLSLTLFWALATSFWAIATSFWQLQLIILALSFLGASAMRAFSLVSLSSNDPKIKQLEKFCREVLSGFPYHRQTDEGQKQSMAL